MKNRKILVFGTDIEVISMLKGSYDTEAISSRTSLFKKIGEDAGSFVIVDCDNKEINGLSLFKEIKKASPETQVIMMSSGVTIPEAVEAAKLGVSDFLKKPLLKEKLLESVKKNFMRETLPIKLDMGDDALWLAGTSPKIRKFISHMEGAIRGKKNIVFVSHPGAEALSLANIIHANSGKGKKMATIDMLAFQKEGAETIFWTVLQNALRDSGTLFLENFGIVPQKNKQSIIEYIKSKVLAGQVRVVAQISGKDIDDAFSDWENIDVPPLCERKEDIYTILEAYVDMFARKHGKSVRNISMDVLSMITNYSWPGNYRELECFLENAVLACKGDTLDLQAVQIGSRMLMETLASNAPDDMRDFSAKLEKNLIKIYQKKTGSEDEAAKLLDIPKKRVTDL